MSWQELQEGNSELASFGAGRLGAQRVAYLATVDIAGAPRVHPVTPILAPGRLFVFMEPTSPKGQDLERGSRYALHCSVEDEQGGGGEFRVRGRARRISDPADRDLAAEHASYQPKEEYVLFELLVHDAFATTYAEDGTPVRQRWSLDEPRRPFASLEELAAYVHREAGRAMPEGWVLSQADPHAWRIHRSGYKETDYILRFTDDLAYLLILHGNTDAGGGMRVTLALQQGHVIETRWLSLFDLATCLEWVMEEREPNRWGLT